jgi:protein TonB
MLHSLSRLVRTVDKLLPSQTVTVSRTSLDPMLLYGDMQTEKKCLVMASIAACLFHLIVFTVINFPARHTIFEPAKQVLMLARLVDPQPGSLAAGFRRPGISLNSAPKPASAVVPIPDPTPADPEPIRRADASLIPPTVRITGDDLTIGDIGAPSDRPGSNGNGVSDQPGLDTGTFPGGTGEGLNGPATSLPVLISHQLPQYTDEAIRRHVEGVVFLQVVIRKNGKADSFQVVRGLGYGLEERAIQEIARSWTFRPATRGGVAIDYPTLIEVTFSLR